MKIELNRDDSNLVKDNETYTLLDNTTLNKLIVSKTILHPSQETTGHKHKGQEEVYQFTSGHGRMEVGDKHISVGPDSIVLIPDGDFHKVWNLSETEDLIFVCVFDGQRKH